jgi:hypothetical protein
MIAILVSVISALAALSGVVFSYRLTKLREHDAEWRKLRLDRYNEFLKAFSATIRNQATLEDRIKYADAVNNLTLVAPGQVLTALYRLQDSIGSLTEGVSKKSAEAYASDLIHAMRDDVRPLTSENDRHIILRMMSP